MGWFFRETRGPAWKQGWAQQTISSLSPPPPPLLALLGIICLLLLLSSYVNYKKEVHHTVLNLKLFLLFLPVLLILATKYVSRFERLVIPYGRAKRELEYRTRDMPWGMVVLVALLLVMLSYQSYFHSLWSPNIWRSYY
ncbi:hypothetical protein SLA2020_450260 [Shorea laevis]